LFFVYVLFSENSNRFYIGITENVEKRLKIHNAGKVKSTKAFIPWDVIHFEEYVSRIDARKREKYLKSAAGRR